MTEQIPTQEPAVLPEPEGDLPRLSTAGRAALFSAAFVLVPIVAVATAVAALLGAVFLGFEGQSAPVALASTLVVELAVVGVIALLVRAFYRKPLLEGMRWSRDYSTRGRSLVWMGIALAVAVMAASTLFPPSDPPLQDLLDTPEAIALFAVFGILFAPFLEEIIFRGFYYRVVEDLAGTAVAVPATAILFTVLHVPQLWGSWPAIFLILVVGYILSRLRSRTGSLIPPFVVHTVYNSTLFLAAALGTLASGAE